MTLEDQRNLYCVLLYSQLRVMAATGLRLHAFFRGSGYLPHGLWSTLNYEEFTAVLEAPIPHVLCVGGTVFVELNELVLIRGDFDVQVVSLSQFQTTAAGVVPDFTKFTVTDCGQTICFGEYEAALDAIS